MHIRCPHCQNPIEILDDASFSDISCSSCGSGFSLIGDDLTRAETGSGDLIGHFTIQAKLGFGGFGTVWKAEDTELDRTVAIKFPRKGQLNEEETEQFIREARAAAQLKHPNIVSVHEVGKDETKGQIYIVSDFVDGITLADWLSGQQPTLNHSAALCEKIAEALHHAHERGVIHRDLKPGNIMLDKQSEPHIMDFGLAKREAGEITMTVEGNILGTPAYMSPEQARGEGHDADARSDIYSLGVILYELLTGERPFRGNKRMLLHQVLYEEPKTPRALNDRIPKDLETICLKCMEKEPENRYRSALLVAEELSRYSNDEPIHARPIGRGERWRRWGKRNPLVASLSAVVVMTLLIGTVVSSYFAVETNAALDKANAANQKKDEALDNANAANQKKDEALIETRKTIDNYVKTVQNAELLKEERFTPLLKELLKGALTHYERFIDQHEHDDESLDNLARALDRVARISNESGDVEKGIESYRKTIEIREKIVAKNPTVTEYQNALASSHNNIGVVYKSTGKPDKALVSYKKALELREKLVEENPTVAEYQNGLAVNHNNIGLLYKSTRNPDKALVSYEKALEIREKLVEKNPTVTEYQNDLAGNHNNIGILYKSNGKPDEALVSYKKGLEIFEKLVEENPTVTEYQSGLAKSHLNIGVLYGLTGKPDEALVSFNKGLEIQEKLVEENPTVIEYKWGLAGSHYNIGKMQESTGKPDEVLVSYKKGVEIYEKLVEENPTVTEYQNGLASSHINIGRLYESTERPDEANVSYRKAVEIYEKLVEENPSLIGMAIHLGGSYGNTANLALSQKDHETATTYHELGVKTLRKVVKSNPGNSTAKLFLRNAYIGRARLRQTLERFDEAVADWEKAFELATKKYKPFIKKSRDAAEAKAKLQKQQKTLKQTGVKKRATLH